jgi:hypothetical protein
MSWKTVNYSSLNFSEFWINWQSTIISFLWLLEMMGPESIWIIIHQIMFDMSMNEMCLGDCDMHIM